MATNGLDYFVTLVNERTEVLCKVCGSICEARRNIKGSTGFAAAIAHITHLHDEFICPHTHEEWHITALAIYENIQDCPSKRIKELLQLDLNDQLKQLGDQA